MEGIQPSNNIGIGNNVAQNNAKDADSFSNIYGIYVICVRTHYNHPPLSIFEKK